jgi:predicted ATPase
MSYYYPNHLNGHIGFVLNKLILKNHKIFGKNFEVLFLEENDFNQSFSLQAPYTSLIIGPNGTGKSLLLKEISDILLDLQTLKENQINQKKYIQKYNNSLFYLSYYLDGSFFEISNYEKQSTSDNEFVKTILKIKINKVDQIIDHLLLPENIIVSSLLLNDKFTLTQKFPKYYKYLGVRSISSPGVARTKNYVKRTVDLIINCLSSNNTEINYKISNLLSFLNFEDTFIIQYTPKYKDKFYTGFLTKDGFTQLFNNYNHDDLGFSKRKSEIFKPFGVTYFENKIRDNNKILEEIVEFLNFISKSGLLIPKEKSRTLVFEFDLLNQKLRLDQYEILNHLQSLDLLSFPSIIVNRNNENINLEETSSGEYHILSNLIGLYASITHNSIILLDEPEISLHPNWQMRYMSFIKDLFKDYPSCHFLITSHSHFFASDLDGRSSKIIGLKRGDDNIEIVDLPKDINTYGWSAEEILLNIFKVSTSRNYFVAEKLGLILDFIADPKSTAESIKDKFYELEIDKLKNLSNEDPLKVVYDTIIKEYVSN